MQSSPITDEELTAFLDGEADPELAARITMMRESDPVVADRLHALQIDVAAIRDAFSLDQLNPPAFVQPAAAAPAKRIGWAMPAAIAASFIAGLLVTSIVRPAPAPSWVDMVAAYQALYVTETLAGPVQSPGSFEGVMARAQDLLGVDLRGAAGLQGLEFKRAQVLGFDQAPLIQIAYLDADGAPFAFCITNTAQADVVAGQMMAHGLAVNAWSENGIGYVLVGGDDVDEVVALSSSLKALL